MSHAGDEQIKTTSMTMRAGVRAQGYEYDCGRDYQCLYGQQYGSVADCRHGYQYEYDYEYIYNYNYDD